ncbi:response regulator [Sulfurimonas sp. SAG-AH-194-I05]|nr:response regulator [Sulfurimonas sp. SAG-AH-194-I05]MDF1875292.1 response regulator [Sulfurimonas sp. SAG-AH-194-I05]
MKYLVTDDSKLARLSIVKSLKAHVGDAEIFQAENGEVAVALVKEHKPDVVFLDLTMPVLDGYGALPLIKECNQKIKVIVVSADIQEQAKTKVMALGAEMHIQKPINADKMQEILELI